MNTLIGIAGLGQTQTNQGANVPWYDNVNNILNKVVAPAANIYTQVKTGSQAPAASTPTYIPAASTSNVPPITTPAPVPQDNTKKYLLIGGGVLLAGGVIYLVARKKKK